MAFDTGGGSGPRRAMTDINVTPLVDVMLVLLIIFMVAAPLLTAGVPLDLPQAKGRQIDAQNKEPVVVSITKDGRIYFGQDDKPENALKLEDLGPRLKAVMETRGGKDESIFLRLLKRVVGRSNALSSAISAGLHVQRASEARSASAPAKVA